MASDFDLDDWQWPLLEGAAMACDRMHEAAGIIAAEGVTTLDRYGSPKAHPAVGIERDARLALARLLRELALDVDVPAEVRPPRIRAVG